MKRISFSELVAAVVDDSLGQTIILVVTIALFVLGAAAPNTTIGIGK